MSVTLEQVELVIEKVREIQLTLIDLSTLGYKAKEIILLGQSGEVTLTQEQMDALLDAYPALKSTLQTSFQQLP